MPKYGAAHRRQTLVGARPLSLRDLLTPDRVLQMRIRGREPQVLCTLATQLLHFALQEQVEVERSCFRSCNVLRQICNQEARAEACNSAASSWAKAEPPGDWVLGSQHLPPLPRDVLRRQAHCGLGSRSRAPQCGGHVKRHVCVLRMSFGFCSSA